MLRLGRLRGALFIGLLAGAAAGCGGGNSPADNAEAVENNALSEVGEAYRAFTIAKQRPPKSLDDLGSLQALAGNGVAAVRTGDVVVRWGATLPDTGEEPGQVPSPEVLAYGKQVPGQGGYVLLLDRTVKKMAPEEFKAAKLAGTESSTPAPPPGKAKAK
jgi:hypothetical protein